MTEPLHLHLELEPTEPIAGTLSVGEGERRRFTGWLDLLAALETACEAGRKDGAEGSAELEPGEC